MQHNNKLNNRKCIKTQDLNHTIYGTRKNEDDKCSKQQYKKNNFIRNKPMQYCFFIKNNIFQTSFFIQEL